MEINLELSVKILEHLAALNLREASRQDYNALLAFADGDELKLAATMLYLEEHNFIFSGIKMSGNEPMFSISCIKIRAAGRDYLRQDGGLTVIKNTITVRFHAETLALLESYVAQSDLPPQDKQAVRDKLRVLPVSAIEHLMKQLLDAAVHRLPDVLQLLRNVLP